MAAKKKGTTAAAASAAADATAAATKKERVVRIKVFRITDNKDKLVNYVRARTRSRALSFTAESFLKAREATTDELYAAGRDAIEVLDAVTDEDAAATE